MRTLALTAVVALLGGCGGSQRLGRIDGGTGGNDGGGAGGNGGSAGGGGGAAGGSGGAAGGGGGSGGAAGGGAGSGGAAGSGVDAGPDAGVTFEVGGMTCGEMTTPIAFSPKTPDVVITFDRSGSMNTAFGTGTRFTTVRDILKPLVTMHESKVRWGFEEFPSRTSGGCSICCSGAVCHNPAFMNAANVNTAIDSQTTACASPPPGSSCVTSCPPGSSSTTTGTSTAPALRNVREFYAGFIDGIKERFVLLSTDGEPNCGFGGIGGSGACTQVVDEIKMLLAEGVKTIVLGVSEEVASSACLEMMGQAGGAPKPGGPESYYPAKDPASLQKFLEEIITGIAKPSCVIDLTTAPPDPTKVAVFFDTVQVPWDPTHANGWDYDPPGSSMRIRIYGSWCGKLESFLVKDLQVQFGCPPCGGTVGC